MNDAHRPRMSNDLEGNNAKDECSMAEQMNKQKWKKRKLETRTNVFNE